MDNQTVFLAKDEVELLFQRAPYLVSMATIDLSELSKDDFNKKENDSIISIPKPTIEPTIGVIDTLFDTRVYFSDWVEYHDMVDKNLPRENTDYNHGTAVSSIIVDGPRFNKWLDDGCGRFKVRHFGVAIGSKFSSFTIMKQIKEIISSNKDIKVWNLSLGSNQEILGLNREVAKALIIDSAKGWNGNPTPEEVALYGHGIVPIRIEDIIKTKNDEIKFLVSDISKKWNTYNYNFPVPLYDDKYPYIAKATMCYFPKCNRTQGVDYTNTELNLQFGRIKDDNKIASINKDKQNKEDDLNSEKHYILEGDARAQFRKWDNVKYISEIPKESNRAKKSYKNKNWGIEVKTTNRLDSKDGEGIRFGIVVTLKEIDGVNRIDEFIRSCNLSGWLVNEIDIKNKIDIHEKINEEIVFE